VRIVITAASGLIGGALAASLERDGVEVTRLVRRPPSAAGQVRWDPRPGGLDPGVLSGAAAVVHLSGAPVAGRRWTAARKQELRDSRIGSTRAIVEAITAAAQSAARAAVRLGDRLVRQHRRPRGDRVVARGQRVPGHAGA